MARRPRSRARVWSEYLAARAALLFLRILPLPLAALFGRAAARAFHAVDGRHRRRVREQMRMALGVDEREAARLARACYRHFGVMIAELARLHRLRRDDWPRLVGGLDGFDELRRLLDEGKGLIVVTGHIGNWEAGGVMLGMYGLSAGSIARPLDNDKLDALAKGMRSHGGQQIWDKAGALVLALRAVRKGQGCAMLLDQDGGKRGRFVPFFGRPASTWTTAADLALKTGAPMIVMALHRADKPMHFVLRRREAIRPDLSADRDAEAERLLTHMNADLESLIREAPEQWLWLHRRWKSSVPDTPGPEGAKTFSGAESPPGPDVEESRRE